MSTINTEPRSRTGVSVSRKFPRGTALIAARARERGLMWHPTHSGFEVRELDRVLCLPNEDAC